MSAPVPSLTFSVPRRWLVGAVLAAIALPGPVSPPAHAQSSSGASSGPAFSLSSGQVFTTRDQPVVHLTFRDVGHLDFRVYKVKDDVRFFAGLRDPHVLGSPDPLVARQRTWIERVADWKAGRRAEIRGFFRGQVSAAYRLRRRDAGERAQIVQRRTVRMTRFAQVPLLNPSQLVASWRELLPRVRDAEARRLPLDLPGQGVFVVEAVHAHLRAYTIVLVSDLGLLTKTAPGQMLAFVAHRRSGEPVPACEVAALADRRPTASGTTDRDGLLVADLDVASADAVVTVARCGEEVVVTDPGAWSLRQPPRDLVGYVYTDRPVYRPGHRVHIKAVLRWRDHGLLRPFDRQQVEIVVTDGADRVMFRQKQPVGEFGSVAVSLVLPAAAALGDYSVQVKTGDREATGTFEVQEYRKPEFEVDVSSPEHFVVQGQRAAVSIRARYYFGQPVAGGQVTYAVYRTPYYSPWRWTDAAEDAPSTYAGGYYGDQISEAAARLDGRGEATIDLAVPEDEEGRDLSLRIEARVTDASERVVAGTLVVHGTHGRFLLAPALDRYIYAPGAFATLRLRALDYRGAAQPGVPVTVVVQRATYPEGRYDAPLLTPVSTVTVTTGQDGGAEWKFVVPGDRGDYRVQVSARSGERIVTAEASFWVPGGTETPYDDTDRTLELMFDRRSYAPGDTARVMIRGENVDGAVLVTKEREITSFHRVVRMTPGATLEVPVTDDDVGDTWVNVAFLKDDRLYRAERRLPVPADAQRLQLSVTPAQAVSRPSEPGRFSIRTLDAAGRPVRAEVSVAVVDDAVYGVKPDQTPDPLRFFHRREYSRVSTRFSREYGFVGYSGSDTLQLAQRRRPLRLADFKADRPERSPVRREFPDAIHWIADLVTAADGTATVEVKYPDALTTWRVTARAVTTDTRVGSSVARTTVTKDLIVRVVPPRFLTEGDLVRVPVIVNSYRPGIGEVDVAVAATGLSAVEPPPGGGARFAVGNDGQADRAWSFRTGSPGTATITASARTSNDSDAVAVSLPVLPYGAKQERGLSGSLSGDGEQQIMLDVPASSNPAAREIDVALSPSLAGTLLGALDFLTDYPYGCTEQTLSSFLPNLLVARALEQLQLQPAERMAALDRMTNDGLRRLLDHQRDDGGWGWWKTDQPHPFMTAYALYGLLEAEAANIRIDRSRISRAAAATKRLYAKYPRAVPELKAYMIWVLGLAEARGVAAGGESGWSAMAARDEIFAARERMSDYGLALLVLALDTAKDTRAAAAAEELLARAEQKGDLAWWTAGRDPLLDEPVDASVEATAYALKALARRRAGNAVLERAVRWLMANRSAGTYWATTKQTATTLFGLLDYLGARDERPATFTVDILVNGTPAGSRTLTPADWTRPAAVTVTIPAAAGTNDVRLVKRGAGTVYWSATARYYDTSESFRQTGSRSLALSRRYFALTPVEAKGRIVYRERPFEGHAGPGDLLLVRLAAAGSRDWQYLVLEDPIPAGTEAVTTPEAFELESPVTWWWGSRREYRDARVVIFQERLDSGRHDYAYLLRVVTPGEFRVMPARLSPMYVPGVSASSSGSALTVSGATTRARAGTGRR